MKVVSYASVMDSLIYAMLCTRPNICFVVGMMSKYQSNIGMEHWTVVKHILKYFQRTWDYMLVYHCYELLPLRYMDLSF